MSKFSGKCDVCDHFCMIGDKDHSEKGIEEEITRTDFYIYHRGNRHRLDIHTYKDLVPYFPYIIVTGGFCKDGRNTIVLSSESFVDSEEREFLGYALKSALKEYKKCKRKKIPFDYKDWAEHYSFHGTDEEYLEVGRRVAESGEKADIDDIHKPRYDAWDRKCLAQEMSRVGYSDFEISQWVYQGRNYDWKKER